MQSCAVLRAMFGVVFPCTDPVALCSEWEDNVSSMDHKPDRQEALEWAQRCAEYLTEQFGASRVIPFGSLLREQAWHSQSDLDLAVEGIPPAQFFTAWSALSRMAPPDLQIELVDLQQASPELRARILQEVDMSGNPLSDLQDLVGDELKTLHRLVTEAETGLVQIEDIPPSQFEMNALASYVHQFYTGCERILERIAIHIDGGVAGGAFSHANLLAQMAQDEPGVRPAVIDQALWLRLQDYLQFRHFFRHAYAYSLDWAKLQPLVEAMDETLAMVQTQLEHFFAALEPDADDGDSGA